MPILNKTSGSINPVNPFQGDINIIEEENDIIPINKIHIRLYQRNARKTITTIEGLNPKLDLKHILSHLKKTLSCNGTIITDKETDLPIIKLTGDQRDKVNTFLINESIASKADIIIHGY
jgi:translation initiation factor SUI1